jgi:hypothetical protein
MFGWISVSAHGLQRSMTGGESPFFAHRAFGSVLLLRQCNTHPGLWSKTERALRMMLLKLSPQIHKRRSPFHPSHDFLDPCRGTA